MFNRKKIADLEIRVKSLERHAEAMAGFVRNSRNDNQMLHEYLKVEIKTLPEKRVLVELKDPK